MPEVGDAGAEGVCQTVDRRRQRRDLCVDAERLSHQAQNAVRRAGLEVREIALPVVDRLIAVADAHVVHLLKEPVIDLPEGLDRPLDLRLVQPRAGRPEVRDDLPPLVERLSVPVLRPRVLLEIPDVVLRLAQQLHRVRLAHGVAPLRLPAQVQRLDLPAQLVLQLVRVRARRPDRLKVRLDDPLRVLLRKDIPDIARHRLPAVLDAGGFVLRLVRVLERRIRSRELLRLLVPPPVCDLRRRRVIVRLRLVHGQDALRVLHTLHVLRRELAAQQPVENVVVLRRQKIFRGGALIRPAQRLELCVKPLDLLQRLRDGARLLLPHPRLGVPPRHAQRAQHALNARLIVVFRPALELLGVLAVVFVQRPRYLLDALRYLEHLHQLVRRMRDACREQLRRHLPHFLVRHIHRQPALVRDAQPPERRPAEIVKVRNIRPVRLRQCDLQIAQPRLHVLVLVIKFRIQLHAARIRLVKRLVDRLLRDAPGLKILVHHLLDRGLQDLLPRRKRHRKRLLDCRRRLPAHPAQIVLRLLRDAVQRQTFIDLRRSLCSLLRCQPCVFFCKPPFALRSRSF